MCLPLGPVVTGKLLEGVIGRGATTPETASVLANSGNLELLVAEVGDELEGAA